MIKFLVQAFTAASCCLFTLVLSAASAERTSAASRSVPNMTDFNFVVEKMRQNYAGYADKTQGDEGKRLDRLTAELSAKAERADDSELADLIREWLAFFQDQHVGLGMAAMEGGSTAEIDPKEARRLAGLGPRLAWDETRVQKYLAGRGTQREPLEGIWEDNEGNYRIGIVVQPEVGSRAASPGTMVAVILTSKTDTWSPGQIKCVFNSNQPGVYKARYYLRDHATLVETTARLFAGGAFLTFEGLDGYFRRIAPKMDTDLPDPDRVFGGSKFFLRRLSDKTLWLRLPHFACDAKPEVDRLLADNRTALESTPNLVIDLRQNGGGCDFTYQEVLAWLYARPIYTVDVEYLSTPDNIAQTERLLNVADIPDEDKAEISTLLDRMKGNQGKFVTANDRGIDITTLPEVRPYPKRVGIIITGAGSSGEQFVLAARQSHKVTLFGGRTSGVLDYSNVRSLDLPSGRFTLYYPISRSLRLPEERIDNVGIAPDISVGDNVEDVVGFVQSWLERQVD